ncbi:hypothetical protein [Polycladidibacter stylochi]|uniref:hypothetical protein n=1 Tax=Polycladidibacter stylochi TaxID=1807766 RepID=UPI00082B7464|nr:hypothetical protein [Pseudovibrio stylochi]
MITLERLYAAADEKLISKQQADALFNFLNTTTDSRPAAQMSEADRENTRFIRGFHDIFISMGLLFFFIGAVVAFATLTDKNTALQAVCYAVLSIALWLLAEYFTKRQRLILPSILLAIMSYISFSILGLLLIANAKAIKFSEAFFQLSSTDEKGLFVVMALIVGGILYGYHLRFKLPIILALMAGHLILTILLIMSAVGFDAFSYLNILSVLSGICVFAAAIFYDSKDTERVTLNSDRAFWLHLLAAPLLVHGLIAIIRDNYDWECPLVVSLMIIAVLGVVALILDRRAMLAAALGYVGVSIGVLLNYLDLSGGNIFALSLGILGVFVLSLGAGWVPLRTFVMKPFQNTKLAQLVPAVNTNQKAEQ